VTNPPGIRLDLNNVQFQEDLFALTKEQQTSVLGTLRKLARMTWEQVYRDSGLKWEAVLSRTGPGGSRLYSLRISQGFRAIAYREGEWLRILSLHPDHDSTYR
jgi:hypothetical protein